MSKPLVPSSSTDAQFNASKVKELLEKTRHYDSDERFMATKDLLEQVRLVSGSVESSLQLPLRECILRLLDDKNSDVSTMAIKCLSQLCTRLQQEHLTFIVERLADIVVDESKVSKSDIVTDGLQTLIASIQEDAGATIAPKLILSLLRGLSSKDAKEIDCPMACLTILKNLLERFGSDVSDQHAPLVNALTTLLEHPHASVRKRASVTLGPLVTVLDDTLFEQLMQTLIARLKSSSTPGTYIQSISAICKSAGVKVGPYLPDIVPKLEQLCSTNGSCAGKRKDDDEEDEAMLELWEQSLQALEAITLRCPNKVTAYVPSIVQLATRLSTYDPLYTYEDESAAADGKKAAKAKSSAAAADDAWGDGGDDAGDAWGDDGGDVDMAGGEGWDDDEAATAAVATASSDSSWQVRRAAVCLLTAFIRARSDILKSYYPALVDHLVSRFKERDSSVKEEVLLCTRDLLRESVVSGKSAAAAAAAAAAGGSSAAHAGGDVDMDDAPPSTPSFQRTRSSYETLDVKLPQIVHACERLFKGTLDSRAQRAVFALLSELVRVRHGGLDDYLAALMPPILASIKHGRAGAEAEASADALRLLRSIIELHKFEVLLSYLPDMTRVLCEAVSKGADALKADALSVLAAVAKLLAGKGQAKLTRQMYDVVYAEFVLADVPLPTKLATISALASILSYVGEADLDRTAVSKQVMPVFLQRLANDSTVQPTLRALTRIANLSDSLDWAPFIAASGELMLLCRKSSHHLKNDVVRCMEAVMRRSAKSKAARPSAVAFSDEQLQAVLKEAAGLLTDNDLHLAHLVLDLASTALAVGSQQTAALVASSILPGAIAIMLSPRLQGVALSSLIKFLQACVESSTRKDASAQSPLHYTRLLGLLLAQVPGTSGAANSASLGRAAYLSIAQCVAGATSRASAEQASATVSKFVSEIVQSRELGASSQLALLVLGEMGRKSDLTAHAGLEAACLQAFDSKDEQVRAAAAFAIGNIAVGNLSRSLPQLLALTQARLADKKVPPHHGYLLFSALKEVILSHSNDQAGLKLFQQYVGAITPLLLAHVGHPQEATRAMVAECLGRLTVLAPGQVLTSLEKLVTSPSADIRAVAITAVRFSLHPLCDYSALYQSLTSFLTPLLKDPDLEVRRQTLLTVNAIARVHVEALPRDTLYSVILPTLYFETKVKPELVREVDYGAFKKIIDEGKPLRRAAFQTLQTLLEVVPHRLDLPEFIGAVKAGIRDEEDIQMLSYQIFIELAKYHGSALLEIIDQLPKLIMDAVKKYIAEAKGKEPESALEVLRSIVRALLVFNQIPGVELCTQYTHFFKQVQATSLMATLIKEATA